MNTDGTTFSAKNALLIAQETIRIAAQDGNLDEIVITGFHQAMGGLAQAIGHLDPMSPPRRVTLTNHQLTLIAAALLIQDARMKNPIITNWLFEHHAGEPQEQAKPTPEENEDGL